MQPDAIDILRIKVVTDLTQTITPIKALKAAAVVLTLFLFQQLASGAGILVANQFSFTRIDPHGQFMWISVHHIVEMVIALAAIWLLTAVWGIDFGLRIGNLRAGLRAMGWFFAVFIPYTVVAYGFVLFTGDVPSYTFPLTAPNVLGTLGFQLLLSGPAEELLFRALPICVMWHLLGKGRLIGFGSTGTAECPRRPWLEVYGAGFVAAVLFAVAHINWSHSPFTLSYDAFQLVYAFVLGMVYAQTYERTGSVVYPMIMHSMANVLMVGTGYLCSVIF